VSRYAVAVTMTKDARTTINVATYLNIYSAASHDEAKGTAFSSATAENPEHQVFHMAIVEITKDQSDAG
jgi:hypothetical protein